MNPTTMSRSTRPAPSTSSPTPPTRRRGGRRSSTPAVALTADGRVLLEQRVAHLLGVALPEMRPLLRDRNRGERDVAAFERLCAEVTWLQRILDACTVLDVPVGCAVELGSHVLVAMPDGERQWVRPVHAVEAFLDDERISATSPLSQAILGLRPGDSVDVASPSGTWRCDILEVRSCPVRVELVGAVT